MRSPWATASTQCKVLGYIYLPLLAGLGTPRDLADVAVDAVLSMDGQPNVLQQSAVLAGIASVRQVYDQQVSVDRVCLCQQRYQQLYQFRQVSIQIITVAATLCKKQMLQYTNMR